MTVVASKERAKSRSKSEGRYSCCRRFVLYRGGTGTDAEGIGTGEVTKEGKEISRGSGAGVMGVVSFVDPRVENVGDRKLVSTDW